MKKSRITPHLLLYLELYFRESQPLISKELLNPLLQQTISA